MKKLAKNIVLMLTALFLISMATSCKKDEPKPTFNGDFTKISIELLESTIGIDSALVIEKIIKDGFVINEDMYPTIEYINNSYGLQYDFSISNGKIESITGSKDSSNDKKTLKDFFTQANDKMTSKNLPLFKGTADNIFTTKVNICEKNINNFKQIIEKTDYESYNSYYADKGLSYNISYSYLTEGPKVKYSCIAVEKTSNESFYYKEAMSSCN